MTLKVIFDWRDIATVRGVDMFPPPVTWMPPNCLFEVDDVLRELTWRDPIDHSALKPSGWIEQMVWSWRIHMYMAMDMGEYCLNFLFLDLIRLLLKFSRRVWARKPTEKELKGKVTKVRPELKS